MSMLKMLTFVHTTVPPTNSVNSCRVIAIAYVGFAINSSVIKSTKEKKVKLFTKF